MKLTIEALRANADINQDEMSRKLGMSRTTYIGKEKNPDSFKWKDIKKIRDIIKEKTGDSVSLDFIK